MRMLAIRWLVGAGVASVVAHWACAQAGPAAPTAVASTGPHSAVANSVTSGREALVLRRLWGVDDIHVRSTASGAMLRFSYRVVDAEKAKILNDKNTKPHLIVPQTGATLEVPETEKVGKLRQTAAPQNGREYWMVFGNAGRMLKPGDHVDIVIGAFRAHELLVESSGPVGKPN
jgi:hypothetical protein